MMAHPAHIHVVSSIEEEASGPSYSVTRLAEAQAGLDLSVGVYSLAGTPRDELRNGVRLRSFAASLTGVPVLSRLDFSRELRLALDAATAEGALLHVHGLWRMPNVYPGCSARRHDAPLVLSPRGMLGAAALAFSARQKRAFWQLAQGGAVASVRCFHATSDAEVADIRAFGLTAPAAVIPNGIDLPEPPPRGPRKREVLYLGRIHPKKGIDQLLQAWAMVSPESPGWRLRIVGPSEGGHIADLQELARRLSLGDSVRFEGPLYGADKQEAYRRAALFVLPTRNENFGMVVAEALAQGTPVISTKGAPWQGLEIERCGWWINHGPDIMAATLREALTTPPDGLAAMGARGRDWMARDFGWEAIAVRMAEVHAWCQGQGERPECVVT